MVNKTRAFCLIEDKILEYNYDNARYCDIYHEFCKDANIYSNINSNKYIVMIWMSPIHIVMNKYPEDIMPNGKDFLSKCNNYIECGIFFTNSILLTKVIIPQNISNVFIDNYGVNYDTLINLPDHIENIYYLGLYNLLNSSSVLPIGLKNLYIIDINNSEEKINVDKLKLPFGCKLIKFFKKI
jgi:hypothetical protein